MTIPDVSINRSAEAACYALLRRLAPALKHDMVGVFQPISLMAALLQKRIQATTPDVVLLGQNSSSLKTLSREAAATCIDLMSWLQPADNDRVTLATGVQESLRFVNAELSSRGFNVVNETADINHSVSKSVVRNVFLASLIALTDGALFAAEVLITAQVMNDELNLKITLTAKEGDKPGQGFQVYRALDWGDVQSLADADGVGLQYEPESVTINCRAL